MADGGGGAAHRLSWPRARIEALELPSNREEEKQRARGGWVG